MSKIKPLFIVAVAITGITMISGDCLAQGSFAYPESAPVYNSVVEDCGSPGCTSCGQQFRGGRAGGHIDELKSKWAHTQKNAAKVIARNEAWPMPFNCASRQLYFTMWDAMIDQGFEEQCVLTSTHFDPTTNELNQFGSYTVAGIMQNMPTTRKKVFIHQEVDEVANQARMAAVTKTINTFYGQSGPARVAFSSKLPVKLRGTKAEAITRLSQENQPTPVISISSGETVSSSVSN